MLTVEGLIESKNRATLDNITDIFCDVEEFMKEASEMMDDIDEKKSSENNPIWRNIINKCQDITDKIACAKSKIRCNMEVINYFEDAIEKMNS